MWYCCHELFYVKKNKMGISFMCKAGKRKIKQIKNIFKNCMLIFCSFVFLLLFAGVFNDVHYSPIFF